MRPRTRTLSNQGRCLTLFVSCFCRGGGGYVSVKDTLITVNNLGLLLEARDQTNAIGSDADKMFRRALPFTPRSITTDPN